MDEASRDLKMVLPERAFPSTRGLALATGATRLEWSHSTLSSRRCGAFASWAVWWACGRRSGA